MAAGHRELQSKGQQEIKGDKDVVLTQDLGGLFLELSANQSFGLAYSST